MERNTDAGDPNLTSFSTSSTSSSSLSPSNPFKQIHAALKRHRPLGTMQSDLPRARRVLVQPKNTASKPSTSLKPQTKLVSKPSQNRKTGTVPAGTSKKESSLTPPTITETLNNDNTRDREIEFENHEKKVGDEMLVDLKQPDVDFNYANAPVTENNNNNNNNNNNDNFGDDYMVGDAPQDSKMENKVSSHMDSLALDSNKKFQNLNTKFEGSNIPQKIPQLKQLNPINADPITQSNPINPITQSSCITKQCIPNYENAPAEKNYENAPVEKKDLIPPPDNKKDKKEKEKEKMKKRGHDTELFFKVNGKYYQKLEKIGSGGSSEVHKVISAEKKIYALKKIKLKGRDYPTALGFCQEIEYLNKLKGKQYIIQLIDYEITDPGLVLEGSGKNKIKEGRIKEDHYIYMVLEYGEKDLSNMLYQFWEEMDFDDNIQIDEDLLRSCWKQMLKAVNTIHEERIVHSDLKPANFLLVGGTLKLIDFGIAKAINNDTTNIQRDAQVGTLSYMSPEAFLCSDEDADGARIKCGRPSDIWSLGCILYQMVYGKTPFSQYTSFWAKFKAVTDRNHEILYLPVDNPLLIDLMKRCLAWDRNDRWTISMLLKHPFFMKMDGPGGRIIHRICMLANHPENSRMWADIDRVLTNYEQ